MAETCQDRSNRTLLKLIGVTKRLKSGDSWATILSDIHLEFNQGEFCAIVGNSGSGKSTLLYLLGILDTPTEGKILLDGIDTGTLNGSELARLRNEKLGFVFQFHYILPEFTALENVMLPMKVAGRLNSSAQKARAEMLLDQLGLSDRRNFYPSQLSGGQLQRVAIARALSNEPLIVLADEPTGNLDSKNSKLVFDYFRKLNKELGQTFLVVTHTVGFVEDYDRIVTVADGRIVDDRRGHEHRALDQ
jgi:lipoprotein-releasing system ATP-binding protein